MVKHNMSSSSKEAVPRCGCRQKGWHVNGALLLVFLFWRQRRRQVGIALALEQSAHVGLRRRCEQQHLHPVRKLQRQLRMCVVVSAISSPKMFSSSVFFHENIKHCASVWLISVWGAKKDFTLSSCCHEGDAPGAGAGAVLLGSHRFGGSPRWAGCVRVLI
jgi:hypothetical protein